MRLFVAALLLSSTVAAQTTAPCPDQKMITVSGTGSARSVPDRVSFTVGVVTTSGSVAEAFHSNNEKTNRIVRALKSHGVKDSEIQTSNFSIDSPYDPKISAKNTHLFTVMNNVTITREDPKAVSELIQLAVDAGANSASNLVFFNSNPTAARDRAIELAIGDARAQADKIAAGVGRTVGAALLITSAAVPSGQPWNFAVREEITVTAAAPAIETGTTDVSYTVTVTYELK
jgi:uncharacterized protein YggE